MSPDGQCSGHEYQKSYDLYVWKVATISSFPSLYKSEILICFFFCTYISSRCISTVNITVNMWMNNGNTNPNTKIKKEEPEAWTYVNFYSHILWKSNDIKVLFITVNICWDRPQRWSIFQSDGMVNGFFSGHHCLQWFFNGFDNIGPSPLNVFWGPNHWNQWFFRWFSKFWGQWSTIVWMSHWA